MFFTCGEDTRHITYLQINNLKLHESQEVNLCSLLEWKILDIWYTNQYHFYLHMTSSVWPVGLSGVQVVWCPIHVQILPLSLLLTVNCTLYVAVLVGGLPVGLIGDDPSHVHVIVASGLPPSMSHVKITVELSLIGPDGVCIIDGVGVGSSEIKWLY